MAMAICINHPISLGTILTSKSKEISTASSPSPTTQCHFLTVLMMKTHAPSHRPSPTLRVEVSLAHRRHHADLWRLFSWPEALPKELDPALVLFKKKLLKVKKGQWKSAPWSYTVNKLQCDIHKVLVSNHSSTHWTKACNLSCFSIASTWPKETAMKLPPRLKTQNQPNSCA